LLVLRLVSTAVSIAIRFSVLLLFQDSTFGVVGWFRDVDSVTA
jgi:hypothetical protein